MIDLGSQSDKNGFTVYNLSDEERQRASKAKGENSNTLTAFIKNIFNKMPSSDMNMPLMGLLGAVLCVQLYQVVFLHQFQCRCPPCTCNVSGGGAATGTTAPTQPARGAPQPQSNRVNVRPTSGPAATP